MGSSLTDMVDTVVVVGYLSNGGVGIGRTWGGGGALFSVLVNDDACLVEVRVLTI